MRVTTEQRNSVRHLRARVTADLPFLLRLALLGQFIRVPEDFITKYYGPEGLAQVVARHAPAAAYRSTFVSGVDS
jgi:hypothetical protein